jgi:hypothetical protein
MRARVADNNIYRWAGMLLSEACKLVDDGDLSVTPHNPAAWVDGLAAFCGPVAPGSVL